MVFDNVAKTIVVVAMARPEGPDADLEMVYQDACRRVDNLVEQLATGPCSLRPVDIRVGGEVSVDYQLSQTVSELKRFAWKTPLAAGIGD